MNKHLLILNILSIKYSMYDVMCDVNYYCILWNDRGVRVSATESENHGIFYYTRSSANNLI